MMTSPLRIAGAAALTLFALISALIMSAARSDFVFRGCPDIPDTEWGATANCSDAWLAQVLFGGLGLGLLVAAALIWRRRG